MITQWKLVPVEPTETMVICGFESEPDECFSDEEAWERYQDMTGCQQAAFRAKLCWTAMLAAAPTLHADGGTEVKRFHLDATDGQRAEMVQSQDGYYCEFEHVTRLTAERDALQLRLTVADEQADILSGGLRLMLSFGSGTNITGVKTVAKQTLNRCYKGVS